LFERFQSAFSADDASASAITSTAQIPDIAGLNTFFALFGGQSFNGGIYRVIDPSDLPAWQARIHFAFPEFKGRILCFANDWLGRAFALDVKRLEDGEPGVLLFEPGTGEVLEVPCNLLTFHNIELIEDSDAPLASAFYEVWLSQGGKAPARDQCIGYKIPLFLGGEDGGENFEVSGLDVYWHLMGQLIETTRGLAPGTPIRSVDIG
jgi:hypothetical protein